MKEDTNVTPNSDLTLYLSTYSLHKSHIEMAPWTTKRIDLRERVLGCARLLLQLLHALQLLVLP